MDPATTPDPPPLAREKQGRKTAGINRPFLRIELEWIFQSRKRISRPGRVGAYVEPGEPSRFPVLLAEEGMILRNGEDGCSLAITPFGQLSSKGFNTSIRPGHAR